MSNQENPLQNEIACPKKLYVPTSVTFDDNSPPVQPNITGTVYVSYDVAACKAANFNTLASDQIDLQLDYLALASEGAIQAQTLRSLPMDKKRELIARHVNPYKSVTRKEKTYLKSMMADINCHTDLNFVVVNAETYKQITEHYKIAVCNVETGELVNKDGMTAYSIFTADGNKPAAHPAECLITFDPYSDSLSAAALKNFQANTWSHEFMHCLGLDHAQHPGVRTQLKYRSVLEEVDSPFYKQCQNKGTFENILTCLKAPTKPTGQDFCALQKLYGPSTNQSATCQQLRAETVQEYPYLKLQEVPTMGFDL